MILKASQDFNIDLSSSWMIGDGWRDIECGYNAGTHTVLLTGEGTEGIDPNSCERQAEMVEGDLLGAVKRML